MGFCRRCGDIVTGSRCKCGGTAVAAVVQWNKDDSKKPVTDRWSQTYVSRASAAPRQTIRTPFPPPISTTQPSKRLHRPTNSLGSRVSAHIASTISSRPSSPLKYSSSLTDEPSSPTTSTHSDILLSPNGSELSKVYGSVLQPKETLDSFHCNVCALPFPPDATLYPDPADTLGARFMCRSCFVENGGSRGDCSQCHRPVLILKSEGGFVENSGKVWHKKCFQCFGCGKSIGDNPMVDLLGQPSCTDCFDTCLSRNGSPKTRRISTPRKSGTSNSGGFRTEGPQSREGSPAVEELQQRLGIRSREATPVKEVASPRPRLPFPTTSTENTSPVHSPIASRSSNRHPTPMLEDGSPIRRTPRSSLISPKPSPSPKPSQDAIEEMKRRFLREDSPGPERVDNTSSSPNSTPRLRSRRSDIMDDSPSSLRLSAQSQTTPVRSDRDTDVLLKKKDSSSSLVTDLGPTVSMSSIPSALSIPSTPDLISDFSDAVSSASSSPPSLPPSNRDDDIFGARRSDMSDGVSRIAVATNLTAEANEALAVHSMKFTSSSKKGVFPAHSIAPSDDAKCAKCSLPLFNMKHGGRYVTVPEPSATGSPSRMYHSACFRCRICDGVFEEKEKEQAVFVRGVRGVCHLDCAPPEKMTMRPVTNTIYTPIVTTTTTSTPKSIDRTSSPSSSSPYSSSRYTAPLQSAPAVQTTFHRFGSSTSCPGCRQSVSPMERGVVPGPQGTRWHGSCLICGGKEARGRNGRRKDGKPGCGKQLDSSAKHDAEEKGVWCRECLLFLPASLRSPQPSVVHTAPLKPSYTGSSSVNTGPFPRIAPQNTGSTTIARQFTGLSVGVDGALMRQMTGGGLSPTRQLSSSPTKQLGRQQTGGNTTGGHVRPRPKSVIGMRDEGRGMFLVRQMTGSGQ